MGSYLFTTARKRAFRKAQEKAWAMRRKGTKARAKETFSEIMEFMPQEKVVKMGDRTRGVAGSALERAQNRDLAREARKAMKQFKRAGGKTNQVPKQIRNLAKDYPKYKYARYPEGY
jgi:hypothetical protein